MIIVIKSRIIVIGEFLLSHSPRTKAILRLINIISLSFCSMVCILSTLPPYVHCSSKIMSHSCYIQCSSLDNSIPYSRFDAHNASEGRVVNHLRRMIYYLELATDSLLSRSTHRLLCEVLAIIFTRLENWYPCTCMWLLCSHLNTRAQPVLGSQT